MGSNPHKYFLSEEERKFYDENGYLVIRKLIDDDTLGAVRQRFLDVCNGKVEKGLMTAVKDVELVKIKEKPEEYINKINFVSYDPEFFRYTEHPRLLHVLSQLMGDRNISVYNSMFINKPPGSKWHPPHQDVFHIPLRPLEKVVSSWTAVDPVAADNGCLFVVPGSHKKNKLYDQVHVPSFINRLFFTIPHVDEVAPESQRVSLAPMQPGDTVLLHALMVHGSWPNHSDMYRKAITNIYASDACQYIDVKGTPHEIFERELSEVHREVIKSDITLEEFYNIRRRHVTPIKSNL